MLNHKSYLFCFFSDSYFEQICSALNQVVGLPCTPVPQSRCMTSSLVTLDRRMMLLDLLDWSTVPCVDEISESVSVCEACH